MKLKSTTQQLSVIWAVLLYGIAIQAQSVRIGTIDLFGNRSISSEIILQNIPVNEGGSIDQQSFLHLKIENSIEKIPGVKKATASMICCNSKGDYHLYIGVAENDSSLLKHRAAPFLRIRLPVKYTHAYAQFSQRLSDAIQSGQAGEDWSNGYSLIHYPPAKKIQEKYVNWADEDFITLSKVLRTSAYAEERATAAQIIAYNPDKKKVIPELMYAIDDENDEVRNNAVRALGVMAYYGTVHPEKKIRIPFRPFIRLINSVVWSDRNKGLSVLLQLSQAGDPELFRQLRSSALPSLKEMALWKSSEHAMPAYTILARMAGMAEDDINKAATGGNFASESQKLVASFR